MSQPFFQRFREAGCWWFRVFGCGLLWKDSRKFPLLFSQRNGLGKRLALHIGYWYFEALKP